MTNNEVNAQQLMEQLQQMQRAVIQLQADNAQLARQQQDLASAKTTTLQLCDDVVACLPAHLQLRQLEPDERKKIIKAYPKSEPGLPKPLRDDNGLATKAIKDGASRKMAITTIPGFQKDHLEVTRIAVAAWQLALDLDDPARQAELMGKALRDIVVISCDNAQKLATSQLKLTFEGAGAKGAYSLLDLDAKHIDDDHQLDIDFDNVNILQHAHVEAITEMCKFNSDLDKAKKLGSTPRTRNRYDGRGGRGGGGRGGGRGRGRGRGYGYGSKNWRGGRGSGQNDNNPAPQDN
jgi:hypothetical protein